MATVASMIVSMLERADVDRTFSVSGESYLGLLDELEQRGSIDVVTCRHEGGAAMMAVADAKLTGRIGVCLVSRGPGASNAAIGIHAALHDNIPLLVLVGQVPRAHLRRDAFQEVDYAKFFNGTAKWTAEVIDPSRTADIVSRAIHVAQSGNPGPVVVALPEDVLNEDAGSQIPRTYRPALMAPDERGVDRTVELIRSAARPVMIVGEGVAAPDARDALLKTAESWSVPVMCSFRRHDLFPNAHPLFVGELGFFNSDKQMDLLRTSDLVLAVGTRLEDLTTHGYTFPASPQPSQALVHVYADPTAIGLNYVPDVALACHAKPFLLALAGRAVGARRSRSDWAENLKLCFEEVSTWTPARAPDGVVFGNVVAALSEHIQPGAVVSMDAGISAGLMYRYYKWTPPQILLTPIAGTMGWGIPGAVAAALRHPDRQVIAMVGDGGMLMNGMELAVAAERDLPIVIILANNASYAAIRVNLDRAFPRQRLATDLWNPDFRMIGRAFGCRTLAIDTEDQVVPILEEAFAGSRLTLVEVRTSLESVLPSAAASSAAQG